MTTSLNWPLWLEAKFRDTRLNSGPSSNQGSLMRRFSFLVAATLTALAVMAGPAAAHHLIVNPVGGDKAIDKWIGGPPTFVLPDQAQGEGLFPGPPFAPENKQPAAHGAGLINACEATLSNPVVAILGPGPTPCIHG